MLEAGNRLQINSLTENTPAANAANRFYTPKIQALLRAANWGFARKQVLGTQLKATIIDGAVSDDPPPQPWQFSYARPSDALKIRFLMPYVTPGTAGTPITTAPQVTLNQSPLPTGIPFVDAVDLNSLDQHIPVVLTDLQNAQIVYTSDLSQTPDIWDALFLNAATAVLASFFVTALSRDLPAMNMQIQIAKGALDIARAGDANERIANADHIPDWIGSRMQTANSINWWGSNPNGTSYQCTWDAFQFPSGLFY